MAEKTSPPRALRRTRQCAKCPWRVSTNPHEIPNGYAEGLHAALADTIADPGSVAGLGGPLRAMACHESPVGDEAECVGWLVHQLGPGNNIPLRIAMMSIPNAGRLVTVGEQHQSFEDTLPT